MNKLKLYKNIIFDFDGTIADTFSLLIGIVNDNKEYFGIDGISPDEIPRLKNLSITYILREFNINLVQLPKFMTFMKTELAKKSHLIKPFEGMLENIKILKDRGYNLGIVTNNYVKNVTDTLSDEQEKMFDYIYSARSLFGKPAVLNKLIKQYKLNKNETIYVGDEVRDIEAAQKVGIDIACVTWGFNNREIIVKQNPSFVINTPNELLDIVS